MQTRTEACSLCKSMQSYSQAWVSSMVRTPSWDHDARNIGPRLQLGESWLCTHPSKQQACRQTAGASHLLEAYMSCLRSPDHFLSMAEQLC